MIKNRYAVLIAYSGDICSSPVICLIIVSVFRILETFSVQVPLWELNRFASGYIVRVAQNGNCFCLKKGLWYKPKCTFVGDGKFGLGTYSLNIKVRKPVSPHLGLCVSENVANRGSGTDWRWCQETYAITKTGSVVIFLSFFFFFKGYWGRSALSSSVTYHYQLWSPLFSLFLQTICQSRSLWPCLHWELLIVLKHDFYQSN